MTVDVESLSLVDLQALAQRVRSRYSERDDRIRENERLFFMEHTLERRPARAREIRPPTAPLLVRDYQALLTYKTPRFRHMGVGESKRSRQASERVSLFLNLFWSSLGIKRFYEELTWYLLVREAAAIRVLLDADHIPPKPPHPGRRPSLQPGFSPDEAERWVRELVEYNERWLEYEEGLERFRLAMLERAPVRVDLLDPLYVYPEPSDEPTYVFVRWERTAGELRRRWPNLRLENLLPDDKVTWWEVWTPEHYAYWVEYMAGGQGAVGLTGNGRRRAGDVTVEWAQEPTRHGYGVLPIVYESALPVPVVEPSKRSYGTMSAIQDVLKAEYDFLSQYATLAQDIAWSRLVYRGSRFQDVPVKSEPQDVVALTEDEQVEYLVPGAPMTQLEAYGQLLQSYVGKAGPGAGALGRVGARSAAQQAVLAAQGRLLVLPYEHAISRLLSAASGLVLRLIEREWGDEVIVRGLYEGEDVMVALRPRDIGGNYLVLVTLQTPFYEDMMARLPLVQSLRQLGLISLETAADMLELPGFYEEQLRIIGEMVMRHPEFMGRLIAEAMARIWPEAAPATEKVIEDLRRSYERQQQAQQMGVQITQAGAAGGGAEGQPAPGQRRQQRRPRARRVPQQLPGGSPFTTIS